MSITFSTTVELSIAQAGRLADILDGEIAANKNRLVTATLSTGEYNQHATDLAHRIQGDQAIRAALRAQGIA